MRRRSTGWAEHRGISGSHPSEHDSLTRVRECAPSARAGGTDSQSTARVGHCLVGAPVGRRHAVCADHGGALAPSIYRAQTNRLSPTEYDPLNRRTIQGHHVSCVARWPKPLNVQATTRFVCESNAPPFAIRAAMF